jgi:hypothetical protein
MNIALIALVRHPSINEIIQQHTIFTAIPIATGVLPTLISDITDQEPVILRRESAVR